MRKIVELFVKYKFYANLIIAAIVIAGVLSMTSMKKSFFPERSEYKISIRTSYPGASPIEVEEGITVRVEEAIRGLSGIKEFTSTSYENYSQVDIEINGFSDIDEMLMEIKNAVDGIISFPNDAEKPIVAKQKSVTPVLFLNIYGDVDIFTLKTYFDKVEEDFLASGKISQITVFGKVQPEISIEVRQDDLLRYGITFSELSKAILNNNLDLSGGQIKSKNEEIMIRLRSRSVNIDKIGDIVIRTTAEGKIIKLRELANVKKKLPENYYPGTMNGKQNMGMQILKLTEDDLQVIDDYVQDYVTKFNKENEIVKMEITFRFMSMLQSRLDLLINNGIQGLILVIITLALFLSLRLSFWVAWGIPSAFLAMFIVANIMGVTINMISLFGMILVVGILVDDGIVIAENIYTHFEKGKSPMHAAVDGTLEVLPSVITSVTTTIVAFVPLLLLEGHFEMLRDMAIIVILSLSFSLLEAFLVLPSHIGSHHVLKTRDPKKQNVIRKALDKSFNWLRDVAYDKILKFSLKWRYVMITIPIALLFITIGLFQGGLIKATFFPNIDFDSFNINVAFTPGNGEIQTREFLEKCEAAVWDVNNELKKELSTDLKKSFGSDTVDVIQYVFLSVGSSFNGLENGSHAGQLMVFPRNLENLPITNQEISARVKAKIGNVPEAKKFSVAGQNRWGSPVSISLLSRNEQSLQAAKEYLKSELNKLSELKDVVDNNAAGKQEIQLELKDKAFALGFSETMLTTLVRQGFYGEQVQRIQEGRDEIKIWIRLPSEDRETIGQLEKLKIRSAQGEYSLSELANFNISRSPVSINHFNGKREIRVEAEMKDPKASVPEVLERIKTNQIAELHSKFPDIEITFLGQQQSSDESAAQIKTYFTGAFAIILLILMLHFASFGQAFLILLMIPLGFYGAIWGHGIHDKTVSMLSAWGLVALAGVIVNDAVVFLSTFNDNIKRGFLLADAILDAGKSRLRPIILTTVTTCAGLFPLILTNSFQAQFLIPMAIALAYGVGIGTIFMLLFFPALIHVYNDAKRGLIKLWTGETRTAESIESAMRRKKIDHAWDTNAGSIANPDIEELDN